MPKALEKKEETVGMETLPLELSNAIDRELAPLHPDRLRDACFELMKSYAAGKPGPHITSTDHRHAYIASRTPATYGVVRHIFT